MRWCGLLVIVSACASAGTPSGDVDGSIDSAGKRDAAIDAPSPDAQNLCPSTDTCAGAMMLGTVSGDTQNQKLTASGYRAAWFRVRVSENDNNVPGLTLRVAAKVTSPTGVDFAPVTYVNALSDTVECMNAQGSPVVSGNTKQTKLEWGEGIVPNGSDDGRFVSIEIRPSGTNCAMSAMWQLEVEGNYP
jgi:hypothetical protein